MRGKLTKSGVFEYLRGDKVIRELRSDKEVFDAASLDTLVGAHVTIDHPRDFVDSDNWKMHSVGTVLSAKADPPYVEGELAVHDGRAQHLIDAGTLREISCGYFMSPVTLDSGEAEISQTEIRYNHAALGPDKWARLGSDVRLTLDSQGNQQLNHFEVDMQEQETVKTTDQEELPLSVEPSPLRDEVRALDAKIQGLTEKVTRFIESHDKKDEPKKPYTEKVELPTADSLREATRRGIDEGVKLEWRARAAYKAIYPTRDTSEEPRCVGQELCEEILDKTGLDHGMDLKELVEKAEISAARAVAIRADEKERAEAERLAAAYGLPPQKHEIDPLEAYVLGGKN